MVWCLINLSGEPGAAHPELNEHIDKFYDLDIRNAFSHANYIQTEEELRYFVDEVPCAIKHEELVAKVLLSFRFIMALKIAVNTFLHEFSKKEKYNKLPNYEVLE